MGFPHYYMGVTEVNGQGTGLNALDANPPEKPGATLVAGHIKMILDINAAGSSTGLLVCFPPIYSIGIRNRTDPVYTYCSQLLRHLASQNSCLNLYVHLITIR